MDGIASPGREVLEVRLRDLASRTGREPLDKLELRHLVEVASNHSLPMPRLLTDERLGRAVEDDPARGLCPSPELADRPEEFTAGSIRHFRKILDEIKLIGDKCLHEVGLFGKQTDHGLDLVQLGRGSYLAASAFLQLLSEDQRLRESLRQIRIWNLPIDRRSSC